MKDHQTLQDFVMDTHFCNWVCGTDPEANAFWSAQMEAYPEKAELVKQARTIVLGLSAGGERLREHDKDLIWAKIQSRQHIDIKSGNYTLPKVSNRLLIWRAVARVAAGLAAIIVLYAAAYLWAGTGQKGEFVQYKTKYGQVKRVSLPDGSTVVLNANSGLSFYKNWDSRDAREVQLEGEAFFSVIHKADNQKFKVKLADDLAIEVVGTKFTVTRRPQKTRVVLAEGKVKVAVTEETMMGFSSNIKAAEVLTPGELIELNQQSEMLYKELVPEPALYAAFQHNRLVFIDAPLTEVARVLKDNYGYDVVFSETATQRRRFTGAVPFNRLDILFTALEKLYNLKILEKGKQIEIV